MVIDCHVHFHGPDVYEKMLADQWRTGAERFNVVVTGGWSDRAGSFKLAEALWLKRRHPDRVYVFGGLDFAGIEPGGRGRPRTPFVEQLDRLVAIGCDGVKLLHGKPDWRKEIGHPLDGPLFEPLLARLEETRLPVLWHIGDPPEFWNPDAVPLWAKQQKWWYDSTFPPKGQIDAEALSAFRRHPKLNLILAHFFFMSDDLAAAGRFLDEFPGFHLDLAPGVEMYHNFTARRDEAREFFIRYADRILYGTDIGAGRHVTGPGRGRMVRRWLETADEFPVPDDPLMTPDERPSLRGIALAGDALERIYAGNFRRILGADRPRPLDAQAVDMLVRGLAS